MNLAGTVAAIRLRCPRCRAGKLFASFTRTNSCCPKCGLHFESEPGFFLISIFINLALTLVAATSLAVVLYCTGNLGVGALWLFPAVVAICPLIFLRVSRSIWLAAMYHYAPSEFNSRTAPK